MTLFAEYLRDTYLVVTSFVRFRLKKTHFNVQGYQTPSPKASGYFFGWVIFFAKKTFRRKTLSGFFEGRESKYHHPKGGSASFWVAGWSRKFTLIALSMAIGAIFRDPPLCEGGF